jgi:cytochrome c553
MKPLVQLIVAALAAAALAASAQQPAPSAPSFAAPNLTDKGVGALTVSCAMCHGPDGRPVEGSIVAALAGRPASDVVAQMKAFKEGTRQATVMHQIAKGYSDAEIAAMADYFSKQTLVAPRRRP